ncbi:unnamed protein product, partial [Musa textilis]
MWMAEAEAEAEETLKHVVEAYMGLSPVTFFTVLAVAVDFYYASPSRCPCSSGRSPKRSSVPTTAPAPSYPLLMAIKGQVYDVTQSTAVVPGMFYGPGGPYALFAGKDASRALAKTVRLVIFLALQDWEYKFMSEYVKEGTIKTEGSDVGTSDAVERIAETTKGASSQEDHDAQKEDVTAALGAKAEH